MSELAVLGTADGIDIVLDAPTRTRSELASSNTVEP